MSVSPEQVSILGGKVTRLMISEVVNASPTPAHLGIWPVNASTGPRASMALIRPTKAAYMAVDAVVNTLGPHANYLAANEEYEFPIHPSVNTLCFLGPTDASNPIYVRWIFS